MADGVFKERTRKVLDPLKSEAEDLSTRSGPVFKKKQ